MISHTGSSALSEEPAMSIDYLFMGPFASFDTLGSI